MGYSRAILRDGWKYIALRYSERAESIPIVKRQEILDQFNAKQKLRGRPIHNVDPATPFSHVSLIPGGSDCLAAVWSSASGSIFNSGSNASMMASILAIGGPGINQTDADHGCKVGFGSRHPGGSQFMFMDASIHFLSETLEYNINPAINSTFKCLLNKSDGQVVGEY